jgi:hypothetical protein
MPRDADKWRVNIVDANHGVEVQWLGAPFRSTSGRPIHRVVLRPGSWVQAMFNHRTSLEGCWVYRRYVQNIFHGGAAEANALMASTPPIARLDWQVQLGYGR